MDTVTERVHRYLRNEMDADQAHQFELDMMDDDELFQCYEQEYALQQGLRTTVVSQSQSWHERLSSLLPAWQALAAALLIAILGVGLGIQHLHLHRAQQQLAHWQQTSSQVHVLTVESQRSLSTNHQSQTLTVPSNTGFALIEVDVSAFADEQYRVRFDNHQTESPWQNSNRDSRGYLTLLIPLSQATPKPSQLEIATMDEHTLFSIKLQYDEP